MTTIVNVSVLLPSWIVESLRNFYLFSKYKRMYIFEELLELLDFDLLSKY